MQRSAAGLRFKEVSLDDAIIAKRSVASGPEPSNETA